MLSKLVSVPFRRSTTLYSIFTRYSFATKVFNVPTMGDSITDGVIYKLEKNKGEFVDLDEIIAIIETEKVKVDIRSGMAGTLSNLFAKEGDTVAVGKPLYEVDDAGKKPEVAAKPEPAETQTSPKPTSKPAPPPPAESKPKPATKPQSGAAASKKTSPNVLFSREERREKMSRMRTKIAQRLKDSQNTYALLTTFQEVDMGNVMDMRNVFQNDFVKKHNIKLGFMSFFVKAVVVAIQDQPIINAVINGDEIIYRNYVDISVAVATPSGLLVPVIRNCESLSFADIEKKLIDLSNKGKNGKITTEDMAGGTFTISNGGVFGSLMGTPILNPPQSAILGMHAVINRPVVRGENIVARPMMYLALTYDHRLIDGREAALFLKKIQAVIEDPRRIILGI